MTHLLALDQGTTSSRAILFDPAGRAVATAQQELTQHFPRPGWVEHDPLEIWSTQADVARAVLAEAGVARGDVTALGITNQRETTVVFDRATGEPIHRAIVWQDRRTAAACEELEASGAGERIRARTGLVIDAYFSATKVAWILDHVPGARGRAERGELAFGTIDSWLVHRLTGGAKHVTDPSNASRTLLFDLDAGEWSDELAELLRVPRAVLPELCPSSGVVAEVSAVDELAGIPIAGIAGDQQAALAGQVGFERGSIKNTYGTGCFTVLNTGTTPQRSEHRLLSTVAWRLGDELHYALEGSVFSGGSVVQWLRDGLGILDSAPEVETLARQVEDTGDVVLVPAFTGLGAPHWDPHARGLLIGMTRGTTRAHVARAALESIAFQVADLYDALRADSGLEPAELRVDGGAAANDLLLQLQADLIGTPLVRPVVTETTALGAAYLAGLATGVWRDPAELARNWSVDRRFEPELSADRVGAMRARWNEALERARDWARD